MSVIRNEAANPFTPGSGYPPPYMAGRVEQTTAITEVLLERLQMGRPARPLLFTGLRGVGKTALLTTARRAAAEAGLPVIRLEAARREGALGFLIGQLESLLTRYSSKRASTRRALERLAELKVGLKIAGSGLEVTHKRGEAKLAEGYLFQQTFAAVARAAVDEEAPVIVVIDELQQGQKELLGPVLTAVHEANQDNVPFGLVAAGLPYTESWIAKNVTYGGRMFEVRPLDLLDDDSAREAFVETLRLVPNEQFSDEALDRMVELAQGLPYFIQEYGSAVWRTATDEPISAADVERAERLAAEAIGSFYRQRIEEASDREREYLVAVASLDGPGPFASHHVATAMGSKAGEVAVFRQRLIRDKGLLIQPGKSLVQFALPGLAAWLRDHHSDL
ncbi:MAG: ATP-binding protein [Acidimicrobiia bacterium]|nr:ATP-binding protein [Acidimicrobiia bacterium]